MRQVFATALQQHQAGCLEQARQLYRRVLDADPRHADSLHLLGVIFSQTGRHELALDLIGQAIALAPPGAAVYHTNLGNALASLGRLDEAEACHRRSIALDPALADAHIALGRTLRRQGRPEEAAAACYRHALRLAPGNPRAHLGLGDVLFHQEQMEEAAACYRAAIALAPDDPDAHNNLGSALHRQARLDGAAACFRAALAINPRHEEALFNLANVLRAQQSFDAAAECYARALALKPDRADSHNNLGTVLLLQEHLREAIVCFREAIFLRPDYPEAHSNLGVAHASLRRTAESINAFRTAIHLRPDHAEAHHNLGMALLAAGDMAEGWREFEWRWLVEPGISTRRDFTQPQWTGEPAEGRTLFIHAEQGFGDTLQFCRYAPLVRARGMRVVMGAPQPLFQLLRGLDGVDALVTPGDPLPPFDLHCPMLSLPLATGTTVETIPAAIPYLHANAARAASWRARLARADAAGPRIGLVWAGRRRHDLALTAVVDRQRALAPDQLAPLLEVPGLQFLSLQKDGPRAPPGFPLADPMDEMHDFADTAALVANLDLVISVDSAVAHLAGALGRPVWLLDRFGHCWRWLAGRRDSPWYPLMRIYRQPAPGDWDSVLAEVAGDLRLLAGAWHAAFADLRAVAPPA